MEVKWLLLKRDQSFKLDGEIMLIIKSKRIEKKIGGLVPNERK
jgi:hypothetical protein